MSATILISESHKILPIQMLLPPHCSETNILSFLPLSPNTFILSNHSTNRKPLSLVCASYSLMSDRKLHSSLLLGIQTNETFHTKKISVTNNSYTIMTHILQCMVYQICCTSIISQMSILCKISISTLFSKMNTT